MAVLVDVMIPVFNGMPELRRSVQSVMNQSMKEWHCVVCDDGSTDGTADFLNELKNDERFTILRNIRNMGRGVTRQRILEVCTAPYVCMLDAGDVMHPERLERQVEFLEQNNEVGFVASGMLSFGTMSKLLRVRGFHNGQIETYKRHGQVCFATSMFRRDVARHEDVSFGELRMCEDSFFLERYARHNPKFFVIPMVLYYYNEFDNTSRLDVLKNYVYLVGVGLRIGSIGMVARNMAKMAVSMMELPFVPMGRRFARRGREATTDERTEYERLFSE